MQRATATDSFPGFLLDGALRKFASSIAGETKLKSRATVMKQKVLINFEFFL